MNINTINASSSMPIINNTVASNSVNKIIYSEEDYGCFENFEKPENFNKYIFQIGNNLKKTIFLLKTDKSTETKIEIFIKQISQPKLITNSIKVDIYRNLSQYLTFMIDRINDENYKAHDTSNLLKKMFESFDWELDVPEVMSYVNNNYGWLVQYHSGPTNLLFHTKRLEKIESEILETIEIYNYDFCLTGDDSKNIYLANTYKQELANTLWSVPFVKINNPLNDDLKNLTKLGLEELKTDLSLSATAIKIIRAMADDILASIINHLDKKTQIFLKPIEQINPILNNADSLVQEQQRRLTAVECGLITDFLAFDTNGILISDVVVADGEQSVIIKNTDFICAKIIKSLKKNDVMPSDFKIESVDETSLIKINRLDDFYWLENKQNDTIQRCTLKTLEEHSINQNMDMDLLIFAVKNTDIKYIKTVNTSRWSLSEKNIQQLANGLPHPNIYKIIFPFIEEGRLDVNFRNKKGVTILMSAVQANTPEDIKHILAYPNLSVNAKDIQGNTALHYLVHHKIFDDTIPNLLLNHKDIDFNLTNKIGYSPLLCAIIFKRFDCANFFVDHRVDVNKTDDMGISPLILAISSEHTPLIDKLIHHQDINLYHENKNGHTAYNYILEKPILLERYRPIIEDCVSLMIASGEKVTYAEQAC